MMTHDEERLRSRGVLIAIVRVSMNGVIWELGNSRSVLNRKGTKFHCLLAFLPSPNLNHPRSVSVLIGGLRVLEYSTSLLKLLAITLEPSLDHFDEVCKHPGIGKEPPLVHCRGGSEARIPEGRAVQHRSTKSKSSYFNTELCISHILCRRFLLPPVSIPDKKEVDEIKRKLDEGNSREKKR